VIKIEILSFPCSFNTLWVAILRPAFRGWLPIGCRVAELDEVLESLFKLNIMIDTFPITLLQPPAAPCGPRHPTLIPPPHSPLWPPKAPNSHQHPLVAPRIPEHPPSAPYSLLNLPKHSDSKLVYFRIDSKYCHF
jgi:hypothetical protein